MKRSLLAVAAVLLAVSSSVNAEDLAASGYWRAFRNMVAGKPVCGMSSTRNDGATFMIKYFYGNTYLTGHVIKSSWQFPTDDKVTIPLTIGVDRNPILAGDAFGYTQFVADKTGINQPLPTLEFYIPQGKIDGFLNDFSLANKFWLRFDEGSEKPWVMDMTGSAKVTMVFRACALELIQIAKAGDPPSTATQPYGQSKPTQPYGNARKSAPTQPYSSKDETRAPHTPKVVPTVPVRKPKDDGSI